MWKRIGAVGGTLAIHSDSESAVTTMGGYAMDESRFRRSRNAVQSLYERYKIYGQRNAIMG